MSLRVWLPLNGNLDNQGLDQVTVTNNGAVVDNNGKIGKCYSFDGNDDYISLNGSCLYDIIKGGSQPFSIGFWIYQADSTRAIIFGDYSLTGGIGFNIELTAGHAVRFYWNGSPDLGIGQLNVGATTWNHVVLVYDTTHLYGYLNGNLVYTYTGTLTDKNKTSGDYYLGRDYRTGNTALNGKMNDVRIYDHALSPLEVKQISQGLILHYPLNRNGWGQENLLAKQISDSSWSNWQGNSTWASENVREKIIINNKTWAHIHQISSSSYGGYHIEVSDNNIIIDSTKQYTWSCLAKAGNDTNAEIILWNHWRSTEGGVNLSQYSKKFILTSTPTRISWTLPQYINDTYNVNRIHLMMGTSGTANNEIYFTDIKFEEGSIATPWCPNSSDTLATTLGLNDNVEYDTSGYGNNGIKTGTFNYDSNSPKYNVSTKFNGSQFIVAPLTCGSIPEAVTVACWGYESNWNVSTAERLLGAATSSSGWCIGDYSSENTLFAFYANGNYNVASGFKQLSAGWHHFAITFDGFDLIYYVDGQQFSKKTFSTKQVATGNYNINIGRHYGGGCNFRGKMSDIRIYATALSPQDILSLYNNSAYIDNQGNLYGAILREV